MGQFEHTALYALEDETGWRRAGISIMSGTILIYGGTGGIGSETARLLKAKGYHLHLVGRDASRLETIARALDAGMSVADVQDPESFGRVANEAGNSLAGLVYAVGTINLKPLGRLTSADFESDFRLNAMGAALAVQASLPALKAYAGTASVLLFSTVAVAQGFASHASVAMAKGAVEGLTRALGAELAPKIRVNAIAPSLTDTPLAKAITGQPAMAQALGQMHPLARLGTAADSARMAAFLVSDEADWITGQVIGVDGGRSTLRVKG